MFRKKRKTSRLKYTYGKSPTLSNNSVRYKSPKKLNKTSPAVQKAKRIFYLLIFSGTVIFISYIILFSNLFTVTDIRIPEDNLENQNLGIEIGNKIISAVGKNIIFIDTEELELTILEHFPELETIEIKKDYPHHIEIKFSEFALAANIINESTSVKKTYIINTIGYVVKENYENPNLPYIKVKSDEPINTENPVVEATKLKYILDTITYFEDKFGMRIVEVEYKNIPREIHLLTEKNFFIWLDIQRPFKEQLKKLKKSLIKLDIYNENLEYIDLRIAGNNGDKIIYKRR